MSHPLLRPLLALALAVSAIVAVGATPAGPAAAAGTPNLVVTNSTEGEVLIGDPIPVRLTISNPTADNGFNTTVRAVLPTDVAYVPGSATPGPATIDPGDGTTVLVWENLFDSLAGTIEDFDFSVQPGASYDVFPPTNQVDITAEAYTNTDARVVPKADATGTIVDFTGSDTTTSTTLLLPFRILKAEPSTENELLRGVHDHQTVYTLTVENNGRNPSREFGVVDFLPAGLEFLGCGTTDNTTGDNREYAGAPRIPNFGALPNGACVVPSSVTTVETDPDAAGPLPFGVYTRVEWDSAAIAAARGSADLAPNGTFRIDYVAAIPLFSNVPFPDTSTAPQTSNLDNNTGQITTETPGEFSLRNLAAATGDYDDGTRTEFTDTDTTTVVVEDLSIHKRRVVPPGPNATFQQGDNIRYELLVETSEYAVATTDVVVTDVLPASLDFNAGASTTPTTETVEADGTITLTWNLADFATPSSSTTIVVDTTVRTTYRGSGAPVASRDEIVNRTSLEGDVTVITVPDGSTVVVPGLGDRSQDTIGSVGPSILKEVSEQQATLDCTDGSTVTAWNAVTAGDYRPGDHVCYRLTVSFPERLDTVQPEVFDVLPDGFALDTAAGGGWQFGTAHDAGAATFVDDSPTLLWTLPNIDPAGDTFQVVIQAVIEDPSAVADGDVTENLMKFRYRNTAGQVFQERDQADTEIAEPLLDLDKGVVEVDGTAVPGAPADGVQVQEGDIVTYRLTITNTSSENAERASVRDILPPGITCTDVGDGTNGTDPISNGGTCVDAADDYLQWDTDDGIDVAAGGSFTLTYDVVVPVGLSAGVSLVNTAGVRQYDGGSNSGSPFTYVPANNIDDTLTPNTERADDTSEIVTALPVVDKGRSTEINSNADGNGNGEATIGETISYTVAVDIPAGLTYFDASVVDDLDRPNNNTTVTDKDLLAGTVDATLDGGALPADVILTVDGPNNTWRVDFPDRYEVPAGPDRRLVVTFDAVVIDVSENVRSYNNRNRAVFTWSDAGGRSRSVNDTVGTRIVEPQIVLEKRNDDLDGIVAGGRRVTYALDVTNSEADPNGDRVSTANETVVVDTIPPELIVLTDTGATATPVPDGGTVAPDGGTWNATARTITWTLAPIRPGDTVTLDYQVETVQPLLAGSIVTNTAEATTTSMPGTTATIERTAASPNGGPGSGYQDPAEDTLTARGFPLVKTAIPAELTIGETVTYTLGFTIPQGTIGYDATLIDRLPPGVTFESLTSVRCVQFAGAAPGPCTPDIVIGDVDVIQNGPSTSGDDVAFFFDDLVPAAAGPREIVLTYRAFVDDVPAADAGANLENTAQIFWNDTPQLTDTPTVIPDPNDFDNAGNVGTADVDTREPVLTIDKRVDGQIGDTDTRRAKPGDVLAYTLEITNSNAATSWPAYDITVSDVATDDGWVFADTTPDAAPLTITNTDGDPVGGLEWTIDGPLAPGQTATISYTLTVPPTYDSANENPTGPEQTNVADVPSYFGVPLADRLSTPDRPYRDYDNVEPDEVTIELDLASIGDRVWFDVDADGVQDPGEPGIAGVGLTITYLGPDGVPGGGDDESFAATTGADGTYLVGDLPGGAYTVTVDTDLTPNGLTPSFDLDGGTTSPNGAWAGTVAEDADRRDVDFGYAGTGSIGDLLWLDQNLDRTKNLGEDGLGGVDVDVTWLGLDGTAGGGDDIVYTTTTDIDGNYLVERLPAGNFTVAVDTTDLPPDYLNVTDPDTANPGDSRSAVVLAPGDDNLDQDFGYAGSGSIGDRIFLDVNKNGLQDGPDVGLTGVVVELEHFGPDGVPGGGDDSFFATVTGADGAYLFENLPIGEYRVTVVGGITIDIGDLTNSVDPDGGGDDTARASLTATAPDNLDQDFGYSATSVLGDKVWLDLNGNGALDPTEPGLANVRVTIAGPAGVTLSTATNADGDYIFPDIPDGDYVVTIDVSTLPPGVDPTFDFDGTGTPNVSATTLTTSDLDQDFGYDGAGSIGDTVWLDLDGDRVQGPTEPGIAGVTVTLEWAQPNGAPISFTTTTDLNGTYRFDALPTGDYTVAVDTTTLPTGLSPTFDADGIVTPNTSAVTLTAGAPVRDDQDFGYNGAGSIGDTVWFDRNANGVVDADETGLPGVDVTLVWTDAPGGPQTSTTTTAADGTYFFGNRPAGDYTVTVDTTDLPAGLSPTSDADGGGDSTSALTLGDGETNLDQDFGYNGAGSIGDTVYLDLDADGAQGPAEPGVPGQTVRLDWRFGTVDYSTTVVTGADGRYLFDNLPPGDYKVTVVAGIADLAVNSGDPDTASPGDSTSAVNLADGAADLDQDFGYAAGLLPGGPGNRLGDTVWYDVDADGALDPGEPGIAGAAVTIVWFGLDGTAGTADDVTLPVLTTDGAGRYLSAPVVDGSYSVTVTGGLPPGLDVVTFDADGGPTGPDGTSTVVDLGVGTDDPVENLDQDFGYTGAGSIGDTIWLDLDRNGTLDTGEPGIAGARVTITWTGPDGTIGTADDVTYPTQTTGGDGRYRVDRLPAGSFRVDVTTLPAGVTPTADPDGGNDNTSSVTLAAGAVNLDQDFGYVGTATIGDTVWLDVNGDGDQDPGEPGLAGITVTVTSPGADGTPGTADDLVITTVTDADGKYLVGGLPTGTTIVTYDPAGAPTGIVPGSDLDGGDATTATVTLATGDDRRDVDFGLVGTATITGTVWEDLDRDGVIDPGERGLPGVEVTVTWNGPDGPVTTTVTTGADGTWALTGIPPGAWQTQVVTSTVPDGYVPTTPTDGAVTIPPGGTGNVDNGFVPPGSIGDTVWFDTNRNGLIDPGETGAGGVVVILLDVNGTEIARTTTGADGTYLFDGLPPGTYSVRVDVTTLPPGFIVSTDVADSVANGETQLSLAGGENRRDVDFGISAMELPVSGASTMLIVITATALVALGAALLGGRRRLGVHTS